MAIALNADEYANPRVGIFFSGSDPTLDGQCVSLSKWFLGEMCDIPSWQRARGHAKDFGDNLVREGLADIVTSPLRGDLVIWKQDGGGYGHIGVVLSGQRVFEQNVGIAGSASKVANGGTVYAARIDPLIASWRKGAPTFYRVRSYAENVNNKESSMIIQNADNWYARCNKTHLQIRGRELKREVFEEFVGSDFYNFVVACSDDPEAEVIQNYQAVGGVAVTNNWQGQIAELESEVAKLSERPTQQQLDDLVAKAAALKEQADVAVDLPAPANEVVVDPVPQPAEQDELAAPVKPAVVTEASKSATLFVARIGSQVTAAYIIAKGIAEILAQQLLITVSTSTIGWATIIIAGVLVFWAQFGYQLSQSAGWKWAANLKWPF